MRINPDGKIAWFKDFSLPMDSAAQNDAHTYLGPLVLTQEGCAFVARSLHATRGDAANTFVYLNEKGEEKMKVRVADKGYPRFIQYSEKSNSFVLVLRGLEEKQNYAVAENSMIININVLGETVWKKEISFTGTLTSLVSVADGYLLVGNYLVMRDGSGKEFRTKVGENECSPFVMKLDAQGEIIQAKPVATPTSVFVQRVIKINDNSVNLLCHPDKIDVALGKPIAGTDKSVHIMTNRMAQIVCTNY